MRGEHATRLDSREGAGSLAPLPSLPHPAGAEILQDNSPELALREYALERAAILAVTDVKGRITYVNDCFCRISGYSRQELLGQDHRIINSGYHSKAFFRDLYRVIARGGIWRGEICNRAKDGTLYWVDTTIIASMNRDGKPAAYLAVRLDITARKAAEAARHESEQKVLEKSLQLEATLDNIIQGLCMYDADQRIVLCNERYASMYGLSLEDVKPGTPLRDVLTRRIANGLYVGPDPAAYIEAMLAPLTAPSHAIQHLSDGRTVAVLRNPLAGGGWVTTHMDITEHHRATARATYMAHHDPLSGLANRLLFQQRLEEAAARHRSHFAVFMLDLDRFKNVNDSLGHPAGDELLKEVANRLRRTTREHDTVARFGGDEFAVLQPTTRNSREEATVLATRLLDTLRAPYRIGGEKIVIGASIGIALSGEHGSAPEDLLRNADLALYRTKGNGRNGFMFFDPHMEAEARTKRLLEAELRDAFAQSALSLHYQPILDARSLEIVAVEALLRWHHPQRGLISPSEFIPIAEESGLIVDIGEWVLRTACQQMTTLPERLRLAINLSAAQFRRGTLVDMVGAALESSGLAPERLELEITESVLLQKSSETLASLHQIRGLGARIVLDDFGTGFSSLGYLRTFPFDKVKIDKSFVDGIATEPTSAAIICAITGLARALGMLTTAEGVETQEQCDLLREARCSELQGYLFGRPGPLEQLAPTSPPARPERTKPNAA